MNLIRRVLPLFLIATTSFAGWKIAYHPDNIATDRPPLAWDMAGNLWLWPYSSGTIQTVPPDRDSAGIANGDVGLVAPSHFAASGSGRLLKSFLYTTISTSVDSGKRWDTLATVTRTYGILAGRSFWMAPVLTSYRGNNSTGVTLSGIYGNKSVDTIPSIGTAGLDLGILPGDIPLLARIQATPQGKRYTTLVAFESRTDTSKYSVLDTIHPTGTIRGLACNSEGCLLATDDSVWRIRTSPTRIDRFASPTSANSIRSLTLTSTEAFLSTTTGIWRRPFQGGSWVADNAGLGSDSAKGHKIVSDGSRIALSGAWNVYLNSSSSSNGIRRNPASIASIGIGPGKVRIELKAATSALLEVRSVTGELLEAHRLHGDGSHSIQVVARGLHVVRVVTSTGVASQLGWL
ncbi:MAG: hypothetical protein RL318_1754 [Fibrobacterota bacterium]|jgi:hypothetical protein